MCVANSARSQMAEGLARAMAPVGVKVSSAGSTPTSVRPEAIAALSRKGIDISAHFSKTVDEIDAGSVTTVITLCEKEVCPAFLGTAEQIHWGLPDPATVNGSPEERLGAFCETRDEIERRLKVYFMK
jgi:protein-tyrosine-phosphatase